MISVRDFGPEFHKAIWHRCYSCSVPLLQEKDDQVAIAGTGLFFQINGRLCIITAAHIGSMAGDEGIGYIGVPESHGPRADVYSMKDCYLVAPAKEWERDTYDVSLIDLSGNERLCSTLMKNYTALSVDDIGKFSGRNYEFIVAGYPCELSDVEPGMELLGDFFMMVTTECSEPVEVAGLSRNPNRDLMIDYGQTIYYENGKETRAPALNGVSGGTIWEVDVSKLHLGVVRLVPDTVRTLVRDAVRIVAVQSGYAKESHKWIRGLRWNVVAHLFSKIDPAAENEIFEKLR